MVRPPAWVERLRSVEILVSELGPGVAVFFVHDDPSMVDLRPGLAKLFFAERIASETQLNAMVSALRDADIYVELFRGDRRFIDALASGRVSAIERPYKLVYNGLGGGTGPDGFALGRKALVPALADAFGLELANSNAYATALARHKFHYFTLLGALGLPVPKTWLYRLHGGWLLDRRPESGTTVIVKSAYESFSVGVTEASVFDLTSQTEHRVQEAAEAIGQDVCVQRFVPGDEVCVPVMSIPDRVALQPVRAVMAKAPNDPRAVQTVEDTLAIGSISFEPYGLPLGREGTLEELATRSCDILELGSFARIDFRVDSGGKPWLMDVGVSPGLGPGSSAFASIGSAGFSHPQFLRLVIGAGLASPKARLRDLD